MGKHQSSYWESEEQEEALAVTNLRNDRSCLCQLTLIIIEIQSTNLKNNKLNNPKLLKIRVSIKKIL